MVFPILNVNFRAEEARDNYAVMGVAGHLTVPGVRLKIGLTLVNVKTVHTFFQL